VTAALERRRVNRHGPERHGIERVRIRPGYDASLLNLSIAGALLETPFRLLPGAGVELQVETTGRRVRIRAHVLRCAVACLRSDGISYRGAITFDEPPDLPLDPSR
jgi:hypothetical protein